MSTLNLEKYVLTVSKDSVATVSLYVRNTFNIEDFISISMTIEEFKVFVAWLSAESKYKITKGKQ